mgnify:CR=1 FL=1
MLGINSPQAVPVGMSVLSEVPWRVADGLGTRQNGIEMSLDQRGV